ncbi:MAG TPA: serine hydrolase domain-containing protein [Ruminiclostridium sp.]|nr:serine hydrolase domain-containing protein [Ruminiclostridium sp.]
MKDFCLRPIKIDVKSDIKKSLDNYLKKFTKYGHFSGSVLISMKEWIVLCKGYGMADYEHDVHNTPSTVFRIASVTKQFTSAAVLRLQEQGALSVSDPLKKYIPDFPNGDRITLHHLLTNTSGIPDIVNIPSIMKSVRTGMPAEMLVDKLGRQPLEFEPGERFGYSNSGYIILGHIIEKVSGLSYETYLNKNLFEKADMTNTGFDNAERVIKHRASGYSLSEEGLSNADFFDMSLFFGCGCMYSTVEDLYKWNKALDEELVISKKSVEEMLTPYVSDKALHYGYGWYLTEKSAYHNGITYGFKSKVWRSSNGMAVIIVLANNDFVAIDTLVNGLVAILSRKEYKSPKLPDVQVTDKKNYGVLSGTYKSRDFSQEIFSIEEEDGRLIIKYYSYLKRVRAEVFPEKILPDQEHYFAMDLDLTISFFKDEYGNPHRAVLKVDCDEFEAWKDEGQAGENHE